MNKTLVIYILFILTLSYTSLTFGMGRGKSDFEAFDTPNDSGNSISLRWPSSPDESTNAEYIVFVSTNKNGPFEIEALHIKSNDMYEEGTDSSYHIAHIETNNLLITEISNNNDNINYFFKLVKRSNIDSVNIGMIESATPKGNWFNKLRLNNFIIMIIFSIIVLGCIKHAKKVQGLFIRKIKGLDAIDDALGRATEMGKPALFVHGLNDMDSISTIAAINILGKIALRVAEYDTPLKVSNIYPIVLSVSQEVVKESYLEAGRPDAYIADNVFLAASEQFPYVVALSGIMTREKPAANFFVGYFYAESLILAETGAATGAIQIAATDAFTQLPFFITTCDYTLMGEELYAASAYLSRDPLLLGSLRAQDITKAIIIGVIVFGAFLATCGVDFITFLFKPG
ncbi:hypothetical protein SCALIN_C04_0189 [Candidatus Scalindua japonica]|uniref:DUF6754 domain-containing protein n=1 Tax=Candidatus Scalindua japonica TaxID=1284222 RepID=A0A286TV28_9BACT|nr:DUF6754 domain-containing protein [Candidatus Scalindua japonica]GAX59701.1 hypothetical protein SCALIN_C04_0189 [Candidatus Scalindua japonica]